MRLTSGSIKATGWSQRCRAVRRRDRRDLASGGAVGSARELVGARAAMVARFLCPEAERGREEGGGNGRVRAERQQRRPSMRSAAGHGSRSRAVRGEHAAATACPCRTPHADV
jgi:hypothetical protein